MKTNYLRQLTHILTCGLLSAMSSVSAQAQNMDASASPEQNFSMCLTQLKQKALDSGVSEQRVTKEFPQLRYVPRVIELDSSQPEFIQTFPNYYSARVNQWRIDKGRAYLVKYKEFLRGLTEKYGIPGHYLLSFWGLETNFGGYKGKMSTLDSLATLACHPRRSEFFTQELFLALKLMDRENLVKDKMRGSWAGAMGHTQFMPTAYTNYAIDGDGDQRIDLWESEKDALASAAHFLWKLGWQPGLRWGREVSLPKDFDYSLSNQGKQPISYWNEQGLLKANGDSLGNSDILGKLLIPAGHQGPAFLAYRNFDIILRWNNSQFYGIAVGQLANQIVGGVGLSKPLPDLPKFSIAEMANVQRNLNTLGIDVGPADGIMGPITRAAIREFQANNGLIADGFPAPDTVQLLAKLSEAQDAQ